MNTPYVKYRHDQPSQDMGEFVRDHSERIMRHPPETWPNDLAEQYLELVTAPDLKLKKTELNLRVRRLVEVWVENNGDTARRWKPHKKKTT